MTLFPFKTRREEDDSIDNRLQLNSKFKKVTHNYQAYMTTTNIYFLLLKRAKIAVLLSFLLLSFYNLTF